MPCEQFTLPNGLRVIVHEDHTTPKVAVAVWYHVGSANEPRGKSGFAHLYEHLMFNGSEHHDKEYFPPLQEIGASGVNGATSLDQTLLLRDRAHRRARARAVARIRPHGATWLGAITQAKLDEQRAVVKQREAHAREPALCAGGPAPGEGLFPENHPMPLDHRLDGAISPPASLEDVKAWIRGILRRRQRGR